MNPPHFYDFVPFEKGLTLCLNEPEFPLPNDELFD
jgi:hypothetical protein